MKNIDTEINKIKSFVDNETITSNKYDIIVNLLSADNSLFSKIIEEVKNNNLIYLDFYRIFDDIPQFNKTIENSLSAQDKLNTEYTLLYNRLHELGLMAENERLSNLSTVKQFINSETGHTSYSVTDVEKQNILYSLFAEDLTDPFKNLYKSLMLQDIVKNINNGDNEAVRNMLLSFQDFMVPVDYNHVVLNNNDEQFRVDNGLTEDEMKKLKSVSAWIAEKYNGA